MNDSPKVRSTIIVALSAAAGPADGAGPMTACPGEKGGRLAAGLPAGPAAERSRRWRRRELSYLGSARVRSRKAVPRLPCPKALTEVQ